MLDNKFNPLNKTFLFKFAKDNCFCCSSGHCTIDSCSYEEIKGHEIVHNLSIPGSQEYCLWFAKNILHGKLTELAHIYYFDKCKHHVLEGGQHRICVYARLLKKGFNVTLPVEYEKVHADCRYCELIKNRLSKTPNLIIPYFNNIKRDQIVKQVYTEFEIVKFEF